MARSTFHPIARSAGPGHHPAMSPLLSPIELSDTEKLEILQRLDHYRRWESLDDKRYCLACGQIIDGHGVLVVGGTRGTGALRLICPTHRCHAIPMDWALPTDQMLARVATQDDEAFRRRKVVTALETFAVRLRKFAMHFRKAA